MSGDTFTLVRLTEPEAEPITKDEVYSFLRLDNGGSPTGHEDDSMLDSFIKAARELTEAHLRRSLVQRMLRLKTPCFEGVALLSPPVSFVSAVRYYDTTNTLTDLDSTYYTIDTTKLRPTLDLNSGYSWPAVYDREDAVQIDYMAGYEPEGSPVDDWAASIPAAIKNAMKLRVQLLYDEVSPEKRPQLEQTIDALLAPFRIYVF